MDTPILVLTNVPDSATADTLALALVERRAAACVNVLPGVKSIYRWQGKVERSQEITLLIKSTQAQYAMLEGVILAQHPYDVPEIIAIPITAGLPAYLQWVVSETAQEQS